MGMLTEKLQENDSLPPPALRWRESGNRGHRRWASRFGLIELEVTQKILEGNGGLAQKRLVVGAVEAMLRAEAQRERRVVAVYFGANPAPSTRVTDQAKAVGAIVYRCHFILVLSGATMLRDQNSLSHKRARRRQDFLA
jgi:hypothetical protein